jgi:hypothetical protein
MSARAAAHAGVGGEPERWEQSTVGGEVDKDVELLGVAFVILEPATGSTRCTSCTLEIVRVRFVVSIGSVPVMRNEVPMSVVLITGCITGIGLETALAFSRNGDTVYATMRNLAKADALLARAKSEGLDVDVLALDVTDDESVSSAVKEIEARHGAVDVLVNNAGIMAAGAVETVDMAKARAVMETNLWGAVRMMRATLPAMRAKGRA